MLDEPAREATRNALLLDGALFKVQAALRPLVALYPKCPLSWVFRGSEDAESDRPKHIAVMKTMLVRMFPKRERPAILVQAAAVKIALALDVLRVASGLQLGNLNALNDYPLTEESQRVGASVCAAVNGLVGMNPDIEHHKWPAYFWRRGLELEDCVLHSELDE